MLRRQGYHLTTAVCDCEPGYIYKGLQSSITTRNQMLFGKSIQISLLDGPFTALQGSWQFDVLEEHACKIALNLEFDIKNGVLAKLVGQVFSEIASEQVNAFHQRAQVLLWLGQFI